MKKKYLIAVIMLLLSLSTKVFAQKPTLSYKIMEAAVFDDEKNKWTNWTEVENSKLDLYEKSFHIQIHINDHYYPAFTDFDTYEKTREGKNIHITFYRNKKRVAVLTIGEGSNYTYFYAKVGKNVTTLIIKEL
jgi:hypothetical protein